MSEPMMDAPTPIPLVFDLSQNATDLGRFLTMAAISEDDQRMLLLEFVTSDRTRWQHFLNLAYRASHPAAQRVPKP